MPLHVQHVEIGPAVTVHIDWARIAAPAQIDETPLLRDVDEAVAALVLVQDAALVARFGMEMSLERVAKPHVVPTRPNLVGGVPADIADEEIEQAVAVEVEEHGAG